MLDNLNDNETLTVVLRIRIRYSFYGGGITKLPSN